MIITRCLIVIRNKSGTLDISVKYRVMVRFRVQVVGYGENGDKTKRLQVQSKHINLLSSTMDLFSVLVTKFQLFSYAVLAVQSLVSTISRARISFALTSGIASDGILYFFSYNLTVACHTVYVQHTVDYIGFTRTVGVVWACRRFAYSHFCRCFGSPFRPVAVLTCCRFDHRPK